jgi:FkbH-like protein
MPHVQQLRQQIEDFLTQANWPAANAALAELWRLQPSPATASYLLSRGETLREHSPFAPCRLAILRSFTVEPLAPLLRASAFVGGIDLAVQAGEFNAYARELLDPDSRLYQFSPDAVILAAQTRDVAPDLWQSFASLPADEIGNCISRVTSTFEALVARFRQNSNAHLVIHNLEFPISANSGVLDAQSPSGQAAAIRQINAELQQIASRHRGVYLLDYEGVIARYGRARWHDERRYLTMRLPMVADAMPALVREWMRYLHPIAGKVCKALAVDLDNTLWGGVVGEDGFDGIKLGGEYPGAAYQSLQRAILDLRHRGVILAVCSKNNLDDAMAAITDHPGMLLRPQHFAALRIDWNDKARNLREIANELNIGLDSIAFLDDNPAERARIRSELPEVTVIELPDDPMSYAPTLRDCAVFERLALSDEDRERGRHYAEQRQRTELQQSATSLEDFYRSLQQAVEIAPANPQTIARIAQLTQKTNQFNLTTRRYSEAQIAEMAADADRRVYSVRVADRFGDHGVTGVAIIQECGDVWEIDSFLLSCRVIGRTVETAILSFLIDEAREAGAKTLRGWFLPTKKNAPAKEFHASHKFQIASQREEGDLWQLDLSAAKVTCPDWIKLNVIKGVTRA